QLPETPMNEKPCETKAADIDDQPKPKKIETGDLVVRNLKDGTERRFPDVPEYDLTNDAEILVYAVQSSNAESNGVYSVKTGSSADPTAVLSGKGKYEKLAWDEEQTRFAFVSDRAKANSRRPRFALYDWDRKRDRPTERVSVGTAVVRRAGVISTKATLTCENSGSRIIVRSGS